MIKEIKQIQKHFKNILIKVDKVINREYEIEGKLNRGDPKGKYFKKGFTSFYIRKNIRRKYRKKDLDDIILTINNNLKQIKSNLKTIQKEAINGDVKIGRELTVIYRRIDNIQRIPKKIINKEYLRRKKERYKKRIIICQTYKESDIVEVWFYFVELPIIEIERYLKEILKKF